MILQALVDYYDRMAADPDSGIAPLGWSWEKIAWIIELDADGHPIGLSSMYEKIEQVDKKGKKTSKRVAKRFLVPTAAKRSRNLASNLLWDNATYVFGIVKDDKKETSPSPQEKARREREAKQKAELFRQRVDSLGVKALQAITHFLSESPLKTLHICDPEATESMLKDVTANISFRLAGDLMPVFEREDVRTAYDHAHTQAMGESKIGRCLVTGEEGPLARLAPKTKHLGSASGCGLVTFQMNSGYDSYGKTQGDNAPIGETATNKYSTALQTLVDSKRNRIFINDEVLLFWASRASGENGRQMEDALGDVFAPPTDNPNRGVETVRSLLKSATAGALPSFENPNARFFFLGLQPGKARIAIRLWVEQTLTETAQNLQTWFDDLDIIPSSSEDVGRPISLSRLLFALIPNRKKKDVQADEQNDIQKAFKQLPPRLSGDLLYAAFRGTPIPDNVAQTILRRLKSEDVTFVRAALLKAWLTRTPLTQNERKPTVMSNHNNDNIGYCLGRLFAVLEKIQYEALGNVNASIKDKFYASASTFPTSVFGSLVSKSIYHERKLKEGRRIFFNKLKTEIFSHFSEVPAHLDLTDQVNFAIGYYHQRQELFPPTGKNDDTPESSQEQSSADQE